MFSKVSGSNKAPCVLDARQKNVETASPVGESVHFDVVHSSVAVRSSPSLDGEKIGGLCHGKRVFGAPYCFDSEPWLRIASKEFEKLMIVGHQDAWVLIHGASLGLGQLLRKLSPEEEEEIVTKERTAAAQAALEEFEEQRRVLVAARRNASKENQGNADVEDEPPEQENDLNFHFEVTNATVAIRSLHFTNAESVGGMARGKIASGTVHIFDGNIWLRLASVECQKAMVFGHDCAWMLVHGASLGMGRLLRLLTFEEESKLTQT